MMTMELHSGSVEDTLEIARALGSILEPGDVVALTGDLGAGKTVFCKGIGEALGIPQERIVSPSFTIVTGHEGKMPLYHVDAYRLSGEREAEDIGLDELLYGEGVCVVEWAEKIACLLPNRCIHVKFFISEVSGRTLILSAEDTRRMRDVAARFKRHLPGG
jgi:tRNA threonylcarbamoyladenosine biosynthesis protein TsaE